MGSIPGWSRNIPQRKFPWIRRACRVSRGACYTEGIIVICRDTLSDDDWGIAQRTLGWETGFVPIGTYAKKKKQQEGECILNLVFSWIGSWSTRKHSGKYSGKIIPKYLLVNINTCDISEKWFEAQAAKRLNLLRCVYRKDDYSKFWSRVLLESAGEEGCVNWTYCTIVSK